jgi:hypothetical protein
VLVDDAAPRRFVRCRQGRRRVGNVAIQQWLQRVRRLCADHAEQHEEELLLPLGQIANRREQACQILLALTLLDRRRVGSRRLQVAARRRAADLDQSLRAAADGADVMAQCRAGAPRPACAAERTDHRSFEYTSAVAHGRSQVPRETRTAECEWQ